MTEEYKFKYNSKEKVYDVFRDGKKEIDFDTMIEAKTYIETEKKKLEGVPAVVQEKKSAAIVGFGAWGTPAYIMSAETGNYNPNKEV